jgi:hypothetical protein
LCETCPHDTSDRFHSFINASETRRQIPTFTDDPSTRPPFERRSVGNDPQHKGRLGGGKGDREERRADGEEGRGTERRKGGQRGGKGNREEGRADREEGMRKARRCVDRDIEPPGDISTTAR